MKQRLRAVAGPLGMVAGPLAVCCTIHLIIVAGGVGAATGVLGGWLRSPYVIAAGLLTTAGFAALIFRRARSQGGGDTCCPPAAGHGTSAAGVPPVASTQRTDAIVGAGPRGE